MEKLEIVADTREKKDAHITQWLAENGHALESRKLDAGDYTAQLEDMTFERCFVVERKASLDELCMNLTTDRDRFRREFLYTKAYGIKVYLLIEDASWSDVLLGNYTSRLSPVSLLATLMSWQTRYDITVIFCRKQNSAKLIYSLLYYAAREELLYG